MLQIKIILGSTREQRFGGQPANWILDISRQFADTSFELLDIARFNLPFMTDATPPSMVKDGKYQKESTRRWAKKISKADGFIIVTPEYNYGVPAALKNAVDTVANEWSHKPVAFVSYGASAGGARAVEHLRNSAGWLKMYDLREQVVITNYWTQLDDNGMFVPTEQQVHGAQAMLKEIVFWAGQFKTAREKRAAIASQPES